MKCSRSKMFAFAAVVFAAGLAIPPLPATRTSASDHIDSPIITQDRGSDLTDTFAFLDPNDNSKVVLIMSTQGFVVSGEHFGMAICFAPRQFRRDTAKSRIVWNDTVIGGLIKPNLNQKGRKENI